MKNKKYLHIRAYKEKEVMELMKEFSLLLQKYSTIHNIRIHSFHGERGEGKINFINKRGNIFCYPVNW